MDAYQYSYSYTPWKGTVEGEGLERLDVMGVTHVLEREILLTGHRFGLYATISPVVFWRVEARRET